MIKTKNITKKWQKQMEQRARHNRKRSSEGRPSHSRSIGAQLETWKKKKNKKNSELTFQKKRRKAKKKKMKEKKKQQSHLQEVNDFTGQHFDPQHGCHEANEREGLRWFIKV